MTVIPLFGDRPKRSTNDELPFAEGWALAVHEWLSSTGGRGVMVDAMIVTRLDRAAVEDGVAYLNDNDLWDVEISDRGVITGTLVVAPILSRPQDLKCYHRSYKLSDASRTVSCGKCGALLDPYDVLTDLSYRDTQWRVADDAADRARERLADLERRERNAKARVAKWEARAARADA